ncbi:hypothetical protein BN7_2442 [Wickerhamomyces ciferrii]|uniref:Protein kinase domain-containing protein n=1 Tax=Wickerhamomyces ciferrii (strain ATCC 14091 / BCRC 22168 / CBS 111 / JCM 3599 / NBRC 0793 / NRRL Y-1031 F-60-10) TaxID=1206466 RepID=K0KIT2_WICCF|nr:uncharacterized protein BN7_2442 [Wickerhamomyces ciferrii]CCH42896.1 hypothetical protein BN7_2442 [Wickerhamomyces ciferrii]
MWNGYDHEERLRYQRIENIRRERVKQVCQVNDPVLNLSFDMIKEANTIDGDYTNYDYTSEVRDIYELFQLSFGDRHRIRNGSLKLTYDESIYNKLSWFNMSMAKPELLANPILDPNNSFIESLISKSFANENDREICRQDPYIREFTNPSQPLRKNKLLDYHRDVVISNCSEIPLYQISKECNEYSLHSNKEKDVVEIGEHISSLWCYIRSARSDVDNFNRSKYFIEKNTILNDNFMSMNDKSIETRIEELNREIDINLSPLSSCYDIYLEILKICEKVNLTMREVNKSFEFLSFSPKDVDPSNYDLSTEKIIDPKSFNIDIKVSSSKKGNIMMIETTRYKYLQNDFIRFINSTVREQVSLKEFKVIRNLIKQSVLYCKQSNSTLGVISNLSTMIILELDINGSELINFDEEKLFDLKLRYRMINLEDQYLTIRWAFIYLFKQLGKEIDPNVKDELMIQFLWKFHISDNERLQDKKAVNESNKFPNIINASIDNFITKPLPKIFSNDILHEDSEDEYRYHTKELVVKHRNVKKEFGYEIEGIPLDQEMFLKVYDINLLVNNKFEDEVQYGAFRKEVKSLEFINKHNSKCEKEGSIDAIINVPKIYKHFIIDLTDSKSTEFSELFGYAILMEKIDHVDISLNPIIEDTPYFQDLERQVSVMENSGIKHNNLAELGNLVLDMEMKPFILDWGLSEINQES